MQSCDKVLREFYLHRLDPNSEEFENIAEMAEEVVWLRSIIEKLQEPSDAMLNAMSVAAEKANVWVNTAPVTSQELQNRLWIAGMNAAITVAEQEVNDDPR